MNYQHCALYASRAYVLEDNRRYTIFLNNARRACLGTLLLTRRAPAAGRRAPGFLKLLLSGKSVCVCVWMCVCVCVRPLGHK